MLTIIKSFVMVITLSNGEVLMHDTSPNLKECEASKKYFMKMIKKDDLTGHCFGYEIVKKPYFNV